MDWKEFFKLNLFKISFIIVIFLVLGIPYTHQRSLLNVPPYTPGINLSSDEYYGEYGKAHYYDFRPLWDWNFESNVLGDDVYIYKYKFSFSFLYFVLMTLLIYIISCLIFRIYGTMDKNSNTAGRVYSRIGIVLLAIIIALWILIPITFSYGISEMPARGFIILGGWVSAIIIIIFGIIGFAKGDKLASLFNIILAIFLAFYGLLVMGSYWVRAF